jgi:aconitase A
VAFVNQRLLDKLKTPSRVACSDLLGITVFIPQKGVKQTKNHSGKNAKRKSPLDLICPHEKMIGVGSSVTEERIKKERQQEDKAAKQNKTSYPTGSALIHNGNLFGRPVEMQST